jgi:hypothetical protein
LTKDAFTGKYNGYFIVGANIQTGDISTADVGVFSNTTFGYPSYSRKDDKILFTNLSAGVLSLATVNLKADKINQTAPDGSAVLFGNAQKGNWFSNGVRSTATNDVLENNSVAVSPNPFKDVLTVEIQAEKAAAGKAEVFDVTGRNILTYPLSILSGKNSVSINTPSLQAGAYLLKVTVDGKSLTKKVVKF